MLNTHTTGSNVHRFCCFTFFDYTLHDWMLNMFGHFNEWFAVRNQKMRFRKIQSARIQRIFVEMHFWRKIDCLYFHILIFIASFLRTPCCNKIFDVLIANARTHSEWTHANKRSFSTAWIASRVRTPTVQINTPTESPMMMMIIIWFRWVWIDLITVYASTHKWINKSNEKYFYWCYSMIYTPNSYRVHSCEFNAIITQFHMRQWADSHCFCIRNIGSIWLIEASGQLHVVAVALPIFLSIRFEQFIIEDKSAIAVLLCETDPCVANRSQANIDQMSRQRKKPESIFFYRLILSPCVLVIAIAS